MKIALDPYMHRHPPLIEIPRLAAELGYEYVELSPRADFLDWWVRPRAYPERIQEFKKALRDHGVKLASLLPMYRWASPHEDERQAAVTYWKKAIEIAVEIGGDTMNSEFGRGPHPERGSCSNCCMGGTTTESSETAWWRSMEELVPTFEREGINLHIEPHPEDFVETLRPAVDMIRVINSERVKFLYCAPHSFYFGDDMATMSAKRRRCWPTFTSPTPSTTRARPPPLHRQPARLHGTGASASERRRGRDRLGRLLRDPPRGRVRRDHDELCLRLGGTRRGVLALHAADDAEIRRQALARQRPIGPAQERFLS